MVTSMKIIGEAATFSAHLAKTQDNYFSQASGVEARGYGKLCPALGLQEGELISEAVFTNLLSGRNPAGNKVVAREHKVHGIDLVFSATKTVSIAALLTERDLRIVEAHDRAVLDTMREIEARCAAARRDLINGPQREPRSVQTGKLTYVLVRNGFNQDRDPHLHTHVVILNMTEYQGQVLALDGQQIMRFGFNKAWGAVYRAKLAARLKELGYSVSDTKGGMWRMDAVAPEVELEFSARTSRIEKVKAHGVWEMTAWRVTRRRKDPNRGEQNVLAAWRERLARLQAGTTGQGQAEVATGNP